MEGSTIAGFGEKYAKAFGQGEALDWDGRVATFLTVTAGYLSLPGGRIVACDPLISTAREPFVQTALPGRYAVDLALMRALDDSEKVAMARIRLTAGEPVVWVAAVRQGQRQKSGPPGERYGYRSESGTGAFMDSQALDLADFAGHEDIDSLLNDLTANYRPFRYWMAYPLTRRLNVVMFSSGSGAGNYASYFGIDDAGDTCLLVTDFELISE